MLKIEEFKEFDFTVDDSYEIISCMKQGTFFCQPPQELGKIKYRYSSLDVQLENLPTRNKYYNKKYFIYFIATIISALFLWRMTPGIVEASEVFAIIMNIFANLLGLAIIFGLAISIREELTVTNYYISHDGIFRARQEKHQGATIEKKTLLFKGSTLDVREVKQNVNSQIRHLEKVFEFQDSNSNSIILSIERDRFSGNESLCEFILCKEAVRYYCLKNHNLSCCPPHTDKRERSY